MYELIVIGASAGGTSALSYLLQNLTPLCQIPIVVVLHRGKDSTVVLNRMLEKGHQRPVVDVEDKQIIRSGFVYLAPGDYHVLLEYQELHLSGAAPVLYSRPSIDVLFESAAIAYGEKVLGILLTGGNSDGAYGLMKIHQAGGMTIVQDPQEAEVAIMPEAAIDLAVPDHILTLDEIGNLLATASFV
jgi:two-component system chemotaxis response regulator CheB